MRLPLLIAGNVQKLEQCAVVKLPVGSWKIVAENLIDSILIPAPGNVVNGGTLSLCFSKKGRENNLNIYAESQ